MPKMVPNERKIKALVKAVEVNIRQYSEVFDALPIRSARRFIRDFNRISTIIADDICCWVNSKGGNIIQITQPVSTQSPLVISIESFEKTFASFFDFKSWPHDKTISNLMELVFLEKKARLKLEQSFFPLFDETRSIIKAISLILKYKHYLEESSDEEFMEYRVFMDETAWVGRDAYRRCQAFPDLRDKIRHQS